MERIGREQIVWVILRDGSGRVLLGRRKGTGRAEGLWNLPGGHLEEGESVAVAGAREVEEEVGVTVDPRALTVVGVEHWRDTGSAGTSHFVLATRWEGTPRPLEKTSETGWFGAGSLPSDSLPWLQRALGGYLGGQWALPGD